MSAVHSIPGALSKDATKDMCQVDNNICNSEGHLTKLSLASADFDCPNFPKEFAVFEHLDTLDVAFNSFGEDTVENVAKVGCLPTQPMEFPGHTVVSSSQSSEMCVSAYASPGTSMASLRILFSTSSHGPLAIGFVV